MILYSLYGLLTDAGAREKRWGPLVQLRPQGRARRPPARAEGAGRGCRLGLWTASLSCAHPPCPCSLLPLSGQVGQVLWQLGLSGLCRCEPCSRGRPAGTAPPADLPPALPPHPLHPPPPPTSPCCLLHLSLTSGFRVLTVHSAFFISSALSFNKGPVWSAEDWLGRLRETLPSPYIGCRDLRAHAQQDGCVVAPLALQARLISQTPG